MIVPELSVLIPAKKIPKRVEDKIDSVLGMDASLPPIFDDKAKEWFIAFREHIKFEL
jgi:hypothetical protein